MSSTTTQLSWDLYASSKIWKKAKPFIYYLAALLNYDNIHKDKIYLILEQCLNKAQDNTKISDSTTLEFNRQYRILKLRVPAI